MKVIKSGECINGICGEPFDKTDSFGNPLCVGDIVQIWHITSGEFDNGSGDGFTAVVNEKYTSFADGTHQENAEYSTFVMGIKDSVILQPDDFENDDGEGNLTGWCVKKIKCHSDTVIGEKWSSFGFNYCDVEI